MKCSNNNNSNLGFSEKCCTGQSGCDWDGTLRNVVTEPIYVQKVYDAALFNLQGLRTAPNQLFEPALNPGANILRISDMRCRKYFNPQNINDPCNLRINPITSLSGGEFVKNENGSDYRVVGPDGTFSERLIFADTEYCDEFEEGTPVFGTQNVEISGCIVVEIDIVFTECGCGDRENVITLTANVQIADHGNPLILTNFFELCIPSVYDTAFLPRFTEICNLSCETRLATNSLPRDFCIDPRTGEVFISLIASLCVTCEKKIIVPVELCVLSTGFTQVSPDTGQLCSTFPRLFPRQIDENSKPGNGNCVCPRTQSAQDCNCND